MASKLFSIQPDTIAFMIPVLLLTTIVLMYYLYASVLLPQRRQAIFSITFLLSMPLIALNFIQYRPSVFGIPLLLIVLTATFSERLSEARRVILTAATLFVLCLTHAGTYMFILMLALAYVIIYSLVWGRFSKPFYLLTVLALFMYSAATAFLPPIKAQYVTKGIIVQTLGESAGETLSLSFLAELGTVFYQGVFEQGSLVHAGIWSAFVYVVAQALISLHHQLAKRRRKSTDTPGNYPAAVPFLATLQDISKSIATTPFWAGPVQTCFALLGYRQLNRRVKCLLITTVIIVVFPPLVTTAATGALREIYYLLIVLPIAAVHGFENLLRWLEDRASATATRPLPGMFVSIVIISTLLPPVVGNLYYLPRISGADYEVAGMHWLADVGPSTDVTASFGYRLMVDVYANKTSPSVDYGNEMRSFIDGLTVMHYGKTPETAVDNLYQSFNIRYFISSERVIENLVAYQQDDEDLTDESTTIDAASNLDKVYAGKNEFSIYKYVPPAPTIEQGSESHRILEINETYPAIEEFGAYLLVRANSYQVRINKNNPGIAYLGPTDERSLLGDGYFYHMVRINWRGGALDTKTASYTLGGLSYPLVSIRGNEVAYEGPLPSPQESNEESWGTIRATYTFYQDAIQFDVDIANDRASTASRSDMTVHFYTSLFSPLNHFRYRTSDGPAEEKTIYPSDDLVKLEDVSFDSLYLTDGRDGLLIVWDDTSPKPSEIRYRGSTAYDYANLLAANHKQVPPGTTDHIRSFIALGTEEAARKAIDTYRMASIHPFVDGIVPYSLVSYLPESGPLTEEAYNASLAAQARLRAVTLSNIPEAIAFQTDNENLSRIRELRQRDIPLMGYVDVTGEEGYLTPSEQTQQITSLTVEARELMGGHLGGVLPEGHTYTLATIDALDDEEYTSLIGTIVPTPQHTFFDEGLRRPSFARLQGNETGLVILPVAGAIGRGTRVELLKGGWKAVIDSAMDNDDLALFVTPTPLLGTDEHSLNLTVATVEYAKRSGLSYASPDDIAAHLKSMSSLTVRVHPTLAGVVAELENAGTTDVSGATITMRLPPFEGACPYTIAGGELVREKLAGGHCILYVATDVPAGSMASVNASAAVNTQPLWLDVSDNPWGGRTRFIVRDARQNPLPGTKLTVGGKAYVADENGTVTVDLLRGEYEVSLERFGYQPKTQVVYVGVAPDESIRLLTGPVGFVLGGVLVVAVIVSAVRRRRTF